MGFVGSLKEVKIICRVLCSNTEVCISVQIWTKWFMRMSRLEHSWSKHRNIVAKQKSSKLMTRKRKGYRGKRVRENLINYIMARSCSSSLSKGNIALPVPDMPDVSPLNTAAQKRGEAWPQSNHPGKRRRSRDTCNIHVREFHPTQHFLLQKERYSK
jgi:hypothetical protein